jgi:glyoxylase-like metal-dependent hydrolase (beta-lactamase superfamily II)
VVSKVLPIRFDNFKVPGKEMITHSNWQKYYPTDDKELSNWALRSVIAISGNHKILIDTGFGNKQSKDFFDNYHLNGNFSINYQLKEAGLTSDDISDVILTHLHFDHCGGCLLKKGNEIFAAYPNATLWMSRLQWDNAINPDEKESDSFLPENILPLPQYYKIKFIEEEGSYLPGFYFKLVNGHTKGQIIPVIHMKNQTLLFGGDLFPSTAHINLSINMNYDMDQSKATIEKADILNEIVDLKAYIIFQHSLYIECCNLKRQRGIIIPDKYMQLQQLK